MKEIINIERRVRYGTVLELNELLLNANGRENQERQGLPVG